MHPGPAAAVRWIRLLCEGDSLGHGTLGSTSGTLSRNSMAIVQPLMTDRKRCNRLQIKALWKDCGEPHEPEGVLAGKETFFIP